MKLKELKEQIKDCDDDLEVFIRCVSNPCGNIIEAGEMAKSKMASFGVSYDCIIIEPEN